MAEYPEHEKLLAISPLSQAIGEFLDWAAYQKGYLLAERGRHDDGELMDIFYPVGGDVQDLLAEHFKIDRKVIETEKRQMLDELRSRNES